MQITSDWIQIVEDCLEEGWADVLVPLHSMSRQRAIELAVAYRVSLILTKSDYQFNADKPGTLVDEGIEVTLH